MVGIIHTHPNSVSFSKEDMKTTRKSHIPLYVVTPKLEVLIYHDTRKGFMIDIVKSNIKLLSLTKSQKRKLTKKYSSQWKEHIKKGCGFECSKMEWPAW